MSKIKTVQIGARVPEHLFRQFEIIMENRKMSKTDTLVTLLSKGIIAENNGVATDVPSAQVARQMAEELTGYKKNAEEWERRYHKVTKELNNANGSASFSEHPFVKSLQTEGVSFKIGEKTVNIEDLNQLFNFLNQMTK